METAFSMGAGLSVGLQATLQYRLLAWRHEARSSKKATIVEPSGCLILGLMVRVVQKSGRFVALDGTPCPATVVGILPLIRDAVRNGRL